MASTDCGWTVANTSAVVVPLASSVSRKKAAVARAWSTSAKRISAGKV